MANLRSNLIRIAHSLPVGDVGRGDILHVLREDTFNSAYNKLAAKKEALPPVLVKGYDGFAAQVRLLEKASTEVERLKAEIEKATSGLLAQLKDAEKDEKGAIETIKKEYKDNLTAQGDVIIERKTSLIEAQVMLKVGERIATLDAIQLKLLASVTEKYGAEVAKFLETTTDALRDQNKSVTIALKGYSIVDRAGEKTAGLSEALAAFTTWIKKGWEKIVEVAKSATKIILGSGAKVEKAHNAFMTAFESV